MKYVNMATIMLALMGMFVVMMLGVEFYTVGHGLHPGLAVFLFITLFAGGFAAAGCLKED